jgi:hypothetical protein
VPPRQIVLVGHTADYGGAGGPGRGPVPLDQVRAALNPLSQHATGNDVRYEDVSGDVEAYWRLLDRTWLEAAERGYGLVIVEHDIVIHPGVFPGFARCREEWCAYPYDLTNEVDIALGCTRFRASLIAANPDAVAAAGDLPPMIDGRTTRHWLRMDDKIRTTLERRDYAPHRHEPKVEHLNPKQRIHT